MGISILTVSVLSPKKVPPYSVKLYYINDTHTKHREIKLPDSDVLLSKSDPYLGKQIKNNNNSQLPTFKGDISCEILKIMLGIGPQKNGIEHIIGKQAQENSLKEH